MSCESSADWNLVATVADPRSFEPPTASSSTPTSPQPPLVHTISELSPGLTYQFRVTCRNSIGVSGISDGAIVTVLLYCASF